MMSRTFNQFFLFAVLGGFTLNYLMLLVHALDDQSGFIIIDCGLVDNPSYSETSTGITYVSDTNFIDTGESKLVSYEYRDENLKPYKSLRSFPKGFRNCYNINVTSGTRYLIRAGFLYGNYDGQDKLPEFELHLGPNLWDSMGFKNASLKTYRELIHVALRSYIHVCLVNTGFGVPFISRIELRPLASDTYETQENETLAYVSRYDTGLISNIPNAGYRFPYDIHDRFWFPYNDHLDDWTQLITTFTIDDESDNGYRLPSVVMSSAATPIDPTDNSLVITFQPPEGADRSSEYYYYLHFAEVEKLQSNQSRMLYVSRDGERTVDPFVPDYLSTFTVYSIRPWNITGQSVQIAISAADTSTLPPILNAFEIYMAKKFSILETNQQDIDAITNIKSSYGIEKNWQGDPCSPQKYSWEGVKCSYPENKPPRIISLDLSSSGLTGEIPPSISKLTMIQTLDLSNNNLTGTIPEFWSQFSNLTVLNLENNKLTGSVPVGLIEKRKNGSLKLSLCENPTLSGNVSCEKKKHNFIIPVIGSIAGVSILLLSLAAIWWGLKRKRQHQHATFGSKSTKRQFTYSKILKITNNLERTLGKGGFGTVYHGRIDKTQVAVKMLSPSSIQGFQQFQAEVDLLTRVHHINLTSLIGYCNEKNKKGLVYEYMAKGDILAYLSDTNSTWEGRLQIATDAALGLEYLHYGCTPPIIHRDVKSTNILLNENFQAKLSDFGLSRVFPPVDGTHISTGVAGTPGYLAPDLDVPVKVNCTSTDSVKSESTYKVLDWLKGICWKALLGLTGVKKVYVTKLTHQSSLQLLRLVIKQVSLMDTAKADQFLGWADPIGKAAQYGTVEIIKQVLGAFPDIFWSGQQLRIAIEARQENVYSLFNALIARNQIGYRWNMNSHDNILFQAANLAPDRQLSSVPDAALQLQSELQWFKEVEKLISFSQRMIQNDEKKTAREVFTEKHKDLKEKGETWMKDTANSCMLVAALIATVVFTAAFTVPGGNDGDKGIPIFLQKKSFMIFIVSDALSLFASSTSILMFLSILTARYAEEDFLLSLPKRMIIGLTSLFFAMATMMIAFAAALAIVLGDKISWIAIPVTVLAAFPVAMFVMLQLPLFVEMVKSTYGKRFRPQRIW